MRCIFFPEEYWLGKTLEVSSPPSVWKLTEKVMENSEIRSRQSMQELGGLPHARAEFKCCSTSNPDQQALIIIYLQLPAEESMYLPPSMRRKEATDKEVRQFYQLVEAYKCLQLHGCDFTPQFLGSSHGRQDDDGLVPGGFLSYVVFTSVPGDVLGTGTVGCDFGGRCSPCAVLNLSQKDQKRCRETSIPDGMFWTLSAEERAVIRQQFESAFT
ncbi:hypothetical protein ANOM_008873 [Aspergillus nomiae NRRL 13137]|uniref:Uncharacterized protein n=1 Tax=Aspergillus nomiae NRRL (strain ATCC 15546 / NRRL 13137 / CBS 260.88 / M93) TaxID=1509407 RepID=A0A0L1IR34_ASPN3|nr:uncharacterized protein ANOM_008873 [Aspergillus nomiae NRRL 13137]KNG81937.1 hypothetical protein ANOM_008873 [Aspergillus nomiae NRRL 13137]